MKWLKKGNCATVAEVIENNTGITIEQLLNPETNPEIRNLNKAVGIIRDEINKKSNITIVGDYDCDGIIASTILYLAFQALGIQVRIRIPKRFTEGYGLCENIINEIDSGLLITVDNGISAYNEILKAKQKGLTVVLTDHHLLEGELPPADVIINPHIEKDDVYKHYCGAGLAYRLAKELLSSVQDENLKDILDGLVAIATIGDVVPLIGDNRALVINGLDKIRKGCVTKGMFSLFNNLSESFFDNINEGTIAYSLVPVINAAGRLVDNGASYVFRLLASQSDDKEKLSQVATKIINLNTKRKDMVNDAIGQVKTIIKSNDNIKNAPSIIIKLDNICEGIIGIIAGKITEEYNKPCIIMAETEHGILKGSGRSTADIDIKLILDGISDLLDKYGGHSGAAGIQIKSSVFDVFCDKFNKKVISVYGDGKSEDVKYYDLDVNSNNLSKFYAEVIKYAPYGADNPNILFKLNKFYPKWSKTTGKYKQIGGNHFKMNGYSHEVIGFNLLDKFKSKSFDKTFDFIGEITENSFNGYSKLQFRVKDIV